MYFVLCFALFSEMFLFLSGSSSSTALVPVPAPVVDLASDSEASSQATIEDITGDEIGQSYNLPITNLEAVCLHAFFYISYCNVCSYCCRPLQCSG
jgi:hypothetical protein